MPKLTRTTALLTFILLLLFIAFISFLVSLLFSQENEQVAMYKTVNSEIFAGEVLGEGVSVNIIDLRTSSEFLAGHIRGAENIDFNSTNFSEELEALEKDEEYFVYCQDGTKSFRTLRIMEEKGFENVTLLKNGLNSWEGELCISC